MNKAYKEFFEMFTVFVVVLGIVFGGWFYAGFGYHYNVAQGKVLSVTDYKCDGSTSGCEIITVATPDNGTAQVTVTCTYWNNATSLPLDSDVSGWWTLWHSTTYSIDQSVLTIRGC